MNNFTHPISLFATSASFLSPNSSGFSSSSALSRWRYRLRHQPGFFRKILAVGLVVLAGTLAYLDFVRSDSGFQQVATAARDIPAGGAVTEADFAITAVPEELVPKEALKSRSDVASRISAGPISQGEIVTESRFVGPSLAAELTNDPQSKIIAISPADSGITEALRAGDAVDILTAGADGVTALPLARGGHVVSRTGSEDDPVLLIALPSGAAETVAAMQLNNPITLTLSNEHNHTK